MANEFVKAHRMNKTTVSKTTHFQAVHQGGTTWTLAAKDSQQAKLFARNYCLKNFLLKPVTLVTLTNLETGEVIEADFSYTPAGQTA